MNQPPEQETAAIRSEIDNTRRRMDNTMDALGERLHGRHLLDEILGYFRSDNPKTGELGEKLSHSAGTAVDSIARTIKANPMPVLLIGAGVAWMIYEGSRQSSDNNRRGEGYADDDLLSRRGAQDYSESDLDYDRPLEYPSSSTVELSEGTYGATEQGNQAERESGAGSKISEAKDKIVEKTTEVAGRAKQELERIGERVGEKLQPAKERAREITSRAQETARRVYDRSRDRVITTTQEHPLEVGLGSLALGILTGLVLPTPEKVNQIVGPTVDRVRERTRRAGKEILDKGQRVATAAAEAAKHEAEAQGLTVDQLSEKAAQVVGGAKEGDPATTQPKMVSQESGQGPSAPKESSINTPTTPRP